MRNADGTIRDRIVATEIEFGRLLETTDEGIRRKTRQRRYHDQETYRNEHMFSDKYTIAEREWTERGSLLYTDTGTHLELASPESRNAYQAAVESLKARRLVSTRARQASQRTEIIHHYYHTCLGVLDTAQVDGPTQGTHENYSLRACLQPWEKDVIYSFLIPHLVTRLPFSSTGSIDEDGNWVVCPRSLHIKQTRGGTTTNYRGIINLKDQSHSGKFDASRLHLIVGDASISDYSTLSKLESTCEALDLAEEFLQTSDHELKMFLTGVSLKNPVRSLKEVARDTDFSTPLELECGKTATALEIQIAYVEATEAFLYDHFTEERKALFGIRKKVLEQLVDREKEANRASLDRTLDFFIKRKVIDRWCEHRGLALSNPQARTKVLQYHHADERHSLYSLLCRTGHVDRIISDAEIENQNPPQNTRARIRGGAIKIARNYGFKHQVDWSSVKFKNLFGTPPLLDLPDPFCYEDEGFEKLRERYPI